MDIVIVGCGKIGYGIARALAREGISIVIIDVKEMSPQKQQHVDALFIKGNALSPKVLLSAGTARADLMISVTANDETNILCCLTAKQLGVKHTVARVRNPGYALELNEFKNVFGIDVIINPEQQAAREIARMLRFPAANEIETFVGGRAELATFRASGDEFFIDKKLSESFYHSDLSVLMGVAIRGDEAFIPNGDFVPRKDDIIGILGRSDSIFRFFNRLNKLTDTASDVVLIGGGKITQYLVTELLSYKKSKIKIIENNYDKSIELDELFGDRVTIIHGDGADSELLDSEDFASAHAAICLTNKDEDNVLIGLYAKFRRVPKVIIKNNHVNDHLVRNLQLDSVVCPKNLTVDQILRYVRGLQNAYSMDEIKTLHIIMNAPQNDIEALEFSIPAHSKLIEIPLKRLGVRKEILIACIVRRNKTIIPNGDTTLLPGDHIVVISKNRSLMQLSEIVEHYNGGFDA